MEYLQHMCGHEGKGSVLSKLKSKGWATDLSAGVGNDGFSSSSICCLFSVDIVLTTSGMANWPEVANILFQYMHMLRRQSAQKWVFDELKAVNDMTYRFIESKDPSEYAQDLVCRMLPQFEVEPDDLLKS